MEFLWLFFLAFVGFGTTVLVWFGLNIVALGLSSISNLLGIGLTTSQPTGTKGLTSYDEQSESGGSTPVDQEDEYSGLSRLGSSTDTNTDRNFSQNSFSSIKVIADTYPSYSLPQNEGNIPHIPPMDAQLTAVSPKGVYNIYPTVKLAPVQPKTVRNLRRKQYKIKEQRLELESAQLREQRFQTTIDKILREYESLKASLNTLNLGSLNQSNIAGGLHTTEEGRDNSTRDSDDRHGDAENATRDIKDAREEVERLKQEVQQMKAERNNYKKELASAKRDVEERNAELEDQRKQGHDSSRFEQETRRLQAENDSAAKKVEQLEQEVTAARSGSSQTFDLQQENTKLKKNLVLLQIEVNNLRQAKDAENSEQTAGASTVTELQNKLQKEQKANKESAQRVKDVEKDLEDRNKTLQKIKQTSERYKTDLQAADSAVTTLQKEVKESEQAVSTLKQEAQKTKETISTLEKLAKERETTISGLHTDLAKGAFARRALEDKLSEVTPAQQKHQQEVDSLEAALAKSKEALKEAQKIEGTRSERLRAYEGVVQDLRKQLSDQEKKTSEINASSDIKVQELQIDRDTRFKEAELAREEARKKGERVAELEQQVQNFLNEAGTDDLHAKLHQQDTHVKELEAALEAAQNTLHIQSLQYAEYTQPLETKIQDAEIERQALKAHISTLEEQIKRCVQEELLHSQVRNEFEKAQKELADVQDTLTEYENINESLAADIFNVNKKLEQQQHENETKSKELAGRAQKVGDLEAEVERLSEIKEKNKFLEGEVLHFKRRAETCEVNREEDLAHAKHELTCEMEDLGTKLNGEIGEMEKKLKDKDLALAKAGKDFNNVKQSLDICQTQHKTLTQENAQLKARPQGPSIDDVRKQHEASIKAANDRVEQARQDRARAEEREKRERDLREGAQRELAQLTQSRAAEQPVLVAGTRSQPSRGYVPKITLDTATRHYEAEIRSRDEEIRSASLEIKLLKEEGERERSRANNAQEAMSSQIRELRAVRSQSQQQTPMEDVPPTPSKRTNEEVYIESTPEQSQPTVRTPAAIRRQTDPDSKTTTEPKTSVFSFSPSSAPNTPSNIALPPARVSGWEQGRDRTPKQARPDKADEEISRPNPPTEEEKRRAAEAKRKAEMQRQIAENRKRDGPGGGGSGGESGGGDGGGQSPLPPDLKPASEW